MKRNLLWLVVVCGVLATLMLPTIYAQDPTATADPNATPSATVDPASVTATVTADPNAAATATVDPAAPTTDPNAVTTAEASDTGAATAEAGDTGAETSGPPYVCDSTTLVLLLVAESYGFSESQYAADAGIVVTDYDLGDTQTFFDTVQPISETRLDDVLADEAMSTEIQTFIDQFAMEDATQIEDIAVTDEDPSCTTLRQAAESFVLLNLIVNQFQLQMGNQ